MKKFSLLLCLLVMAMAAPAIAFGNSSPRVRAAKKTAASTTVKTDKSGSIYDTIRQQYVSGKISADSVVSLALYHKVGNPALAERCLKLVADKSPRSVMELGVLYALSPEYTKSASEGVKLLQTAAKA